MEIEVFFRIEGGKPQPIRIEKQRIKKYFENLQRITNKKVYLLTQNPYQNEN